MKVSYYRTEVEMGRTAALLCVLLALGVVVDSQQGEHHVLRRSVDERVQGIVVKGFTSGVGSMLSSGDSRGRIKRQSSDGLDWNLIFDGLIAQARESVVAEGKDELPIPDIDEPFERKLGFIKVSGKFEARQGKVNSVSSIRRTGDVFFGGDPGQTVTLTANLGFATLQVRYDEYRASLLGARTSGDIRASVSNNSVRLKARLAVTESSCSLALDEVTVVDLSGFDVRISGLGPLDWLTSKIATWVANKRRDDIKNKLEEALRKNLQKAVNDFNCNEHFDKIKDFQGLAG